jgi:hypothetical protein
MAIAAKHPEAQPERLERDRGCGNGVRGQGRDPLFPYVR